MVEAEWTVRDKAQNDWSRPEIHAVYNPPLLDHLFHGVPAGGQILEGAACVGGNRGGEMVPASDVVCGQRR
jgi:hypothetical protein